MPKFSSLQILTGRITPSGGKAAPAGCVLTSATVLLMMGAKNNDPSGEANPTAGRNQGE